MRPIATSDFALTEATDIDPALRAQLAEALALADVDERAMLEKMTPGSLLVIGALSLIAWAPVVAGIAWLI